ncbi:MAG TPA: DNA polymerase III subunit beta [Aquifex aeolicus]|uniref:Beta sliding clamp n=1 Tax=Aquifex aeolicus TaxID=63363 RepID=A0A9D0YRW4_AQUAO|nr:DNA polymerase III subunit beta [Aquificales bacterium]HIP86441.1 DNA polymerase III subunit beta [Aquifex sp.]HIP98612.1 DNA polymerase III subunit beta [Aquifex aeolicus]HIQ26094.1 DNA polymerase III subunit beta [Aquifex aeolicus]
MKLICDRSLLEKALTKAKEATEKKAALPILTNFLLSAEGENLILKATDLENYLTLSIPATVIEEGKVCVHSKKLAEIVKNGNCSEIIFSLSGSNLAVECGRSKFKLATVDVDEFPEFPKPLEENKTNLEGKLLLEAIDRTDYAIPKDAENLVLNGMYIKGKEEELHFVGTDGHRLAIYKPPVEGINLNLLLPKKSLKVLKKLVSGLEDLEITSSENFAFVKGENWLLGIRLLEGEYPDYEAVIPSETNYNALVETEELIKALKRVTLLVEGKVKPVRITLGDNLLRLEVSDPEFGEASDEIEVEYIGEPISVEFNAKYLIEALEKFDSEKVWLKLVDGDSPALLEAESSEPYLCLIMPMTI